MKYKKILKEFAWLEAEYKKLYTLLKHHPLLCSKKNVYFKEDKESFLLLWKLYIKFFHKLKFLIKKTKYRKFFIFVDYNKLVLRRYVLIFYFNMINDILFSFGKHEKFMRIFLEENFKKDYGYFAKYIYKPRFFNLITTPWLFIEPFKKMIDREVYTYLIPKKIKLKKSHKLITNYKNIYFYIKNRVDRILLSCARNVGMFLSNIRFTRRKHGLITKKNLQQYLKIAKSGDILLTRWNWNATNVSIPGFWKHMSLYLWTGDFLMKQFIELQGLDKKQHYIIESTWEGICMKPIWDLISHNDYLWVSRTTFSQEKIYRSIKNAFLNIGKWYDFMFNYYWDNSLVCSELVLKSYAKESKHDEGIKIHLESIGISLWFPPNNFISILQAESCKEKPDVIPVFFIDSIEKTHENFISNTSELLQSGSRSRLSLFQK